MMRFLALISALALGQPAFAAQCGNDSGGFNQWKQDFASEAARAGVGQRGLDALAGTRYAQDTINADRNQRSFTYTLDRFMEIRGSATIVRIGRDRLRSQADFWATIEQRFGVDAEVIIAIHGMETGFGNFMGDSNVLSAISTLAYDCRRSEFFSEHALAALKLVDAGALSANTIGAKHGEVGHTQFLPGNVLRYGVDADGNGRIDLTTYSDAMASTANFLSQKGWREGAGYLEGQPNFRVIQEWNAAGVYQKAIALMAADIAR